MYYILWLSFLLICCQPAAEKESNLTALEQLAAEKYTDHYKFELNKSGRYTLCIRKQPATTDVPHPGLRFFIFDNQEEKIRFEDSVANGSVEWINTYQVKVVNVQGIVQQGNDQPVTYIYDLQSASIRK